MEFIDLKSQYRYLKKNIDFRISHVINNANFIMGEEVNEFENKIAEYVGMKYAISCSDGTLALQLIYMAYGIGKGDAVFCPDLTFIASVESACMLGAEPIFCDIDSDTFNISGESLERQIQSIIKEGRLKPRAIIAVDFVGNPANYEEIEQIAAKYKLLVIEDAAQSMGASIGNKKCCSFGHIAATSFFPSKPLGCYGDGGAVFTNDKQIAELIASLRLHGRGKNKYDNIHIGVNSRLDTIQAAILLEKLSVLEEEIQIRQKIAKKYAEELSPYFELQQICETGKSAYAQFVLLAKNEKERNYIRKELSKKEIPTLIYYPTPMHLLPVFHKYNQGNEVFTNTTDYCSRTFSLPFSPYLSKNDQQQIIDYLLQALKKYNEYLVEK